MPPTGQLLRASFPPWQKKNSDVSRSRESNANKMPVWVPSALSLSSWAPGSIGHTPILLNARAPCSAPSRFSRKTPGAAEAWRETYHLHAHSNCGIRAPEKKLPRKLGIATQELSPHYPLSLSFFSDHFSLFSLEMRAIMCTILPEVWETLNKH